MLTTNLYGTIVSNVVCGLTGGAGLFSGRNYGPEVNPNRMLLPLLVSMMFKKIILTTDFGTFPNFNIEYFQQYAVFEPGTRNTGTAIAGKNIANPISMMNAAVDLLLHLRLDNHAHWLAEAINKTINEDKIHTPGKERFIPPSQLPFSTYSLCLVGRALSGLNYVLF